MEASTDVLPGNVKLVMSNERKKATASEMFGLITDTVGITIADVKKVGYMP